MANKKTTEEEVKTKKTGSKKNNTKKASTKKTTKSTTTKKLEDTIRIRIDDDRVNDADSLDTSFIEGKKRKKVKENKKAKEKILTESKDYSNVFSIIKYIIYILAAVCVVFLGVLALKNNKFFESIKEPVEEVKEKKEDKVVLPDNYLFVGDFYTNNMDLEDFLYPYVKVSDLEYTTKDLLDNIDNDIYVYNPSTIFIQLGYNDLTADVEESEIISNLEEIIKGIKSNRPYAKIYIESLYPIKDMEDSNITNKDINSLNVKIKKLSKSLDITYIDMYSELLEDNELKENYSDDGINLNEDGYKRVFKVINRIVDEEHEKD